MKRLFYIIFVATLLMITSCIEEYLNSNVPETSFNDSWLFIKAEPGQESEIERSLLSGTSLVGMEMVRLPHSCNLEPLESNNYWQGVCFYKKTFTVPKKMAGKMLTIRFEGTPNVADVWVNGKKCAKQMGGFLPFIVSFSPQPGENIVVVRLDNSRADSKLVGFNSYNGICRNVWLCANDSLSFTNSAEELGQPGGIFVSTSNVSGNSGTVHITANIRNAYSQQKVVNFTYKVLDHNKKVIGKGKLIKVMEPNAIENFTDSLSLKNITLWDIDNPWLYTVEAMLVENDVIIEEEEIDFGFRTIMLGNKTFEVNGREVYPQGVCRHQEYPYVGYAVSDQAQWRDAYRIKKAGFNYVRSCHFPMSESFLKACDSYGIMVLDFLPDGDKYVVRRDRNHPCILAWELDNNKNISAMLKAEYPTEYCNVYFNDGMVTDDGSQYSATISQGENALVRQAILMSESQNEKLGKTLFGRSWQMFDRKTGDGINNSGAMTITRRSKFAYKFFQSQSDIDDSELKAFSDPMCYIASYWIPGESKGVYVYSNCSEVELLVDGNLIGRQKPIQGPTSDKLKHPYFYFNQNCEKPGTVRAIAYDESGAPLAECTVKTPSEPTRIKLVIDESGTLIAANDVLLVRCYILDKDDTLIPTAESEVEFSVSGTAQLLSPSRVKADGGIATALIRTGNSSNDFTLSAKCGQMYTIVDK